MQVPADAFKMWKMVESWVWVAEDGIATCSFPSCLFSLECPLLRKLLKLWKIMYQDEKNFFFSITNCRNFMCQKQRNYEARQSAKTADNFSLGMPQHAPTLHSTRASSILPLSKCNCCSWDQASVFRVSSHAPWQLKATMAVVFYLVPLLFQTVPWQCYYCLNVTLMQMPAVKAVSSIKKRR